MKIDNFKEHYECYKTRKVNKSQFARELDISRPTLYKLIAEYEKIQIIEYREKGLKVDEIYKILSISKQTYYNILKR